MKTLKPISFNNCYNNNSHNKDSSQKNSKLNNKTILKTILEPNEIIDLEKDPFVKITNEKNPFSSQIIQTKDDNEEANLKLLCNEIFGESFFVTDIAWRSSDSSNHDAKKFSVDYNHTLVYSKSLDWQPSKVERSEDNNSHYKILAELFFKAISIQRKF